MANSTITLAQAITAGAKLAVDTITGLFNGTAAPADAVAQYAKVAFGAAGTLQGVDTDNPMPAAAPLRATAGVAQLRINITASGDTTLVAATAGQTTRVHALRLLVGGATTINVRSGATVLEGPLVFTGPGSFILGYRDRPHYVTGANEALVVSSTAAVQISGRLESVTGA
jgi:hypothetical protein